MHTFTRRACAVLPAFALLTFLGCGSGGGSRGPAPAGAPPRVQLVEVASGLTAPVQLTHAGDGSGRLFIVDQIGLIRVVDAQGNLLPTPFLDLTQQIVAVNTTFDERGLLGLAFHPGFAENGRFFVRYSAPRTAQAGDPCEGTSRGCHEEILAEFAVAGDPTTNSVADPESEQILFRVDEPQFNHNAGHVAFGPDGFLYFGLGDGGGANDGLADIPPTHGATGNGQDTGTPLGALLRLDVDATPPPGAAYAIPAGNPFVGIQGLDEIYAYGFRNPYRFSWDSGPGGTGELFLVDVGQDVWEEVDIVTNGGNYGWAVREGPECFDPLAPSTPPATCPTVGALGEPLIDPVIAYEHPEGLAIVGAYVYRGSGVPDLQGKLVYGDFSQDFGPTGRVFVAETTGPNAFVQMSLELAPDNAPLGRALLGLGRDEAGGLYLLASDFIAPVGSTGVVFRIDAAP